MKNLREEIILDSNPYQNLYKALSLQSALHRVVTSFKFINPCSTALMSSENIITFATARKESGTLYVQHRLLNA